MIHQLRTIRRRTPASASTAPPARSHRMRPLTLRRYAIARVRVKPAARARTSQVVDAFLLKPLANSPERARPRPSPTLSTRTAAMAHLPIEAHMVLPCHHRQRTAMPRRRCLTPCPVQRSPMSHPWGKRTGHFTVRRASACWQASSASNRKKCTRSRRRTRRSATYRQHCGTGGPTT